MAASRTVAGLVALTLAGCGVGGEGKEVKRSLTAFLSAQLSGDAQGLCERVTPETRRMYDLLGRGLRGDDGDCADAVAAQIGAPGPGELDERDRRAIDAADVNIDGDTARVKGGGDEHRLPMRKAGGRWLVDLVNAPEQGYGLRVGAACTKETLDALRRPLPPATRAGLAGEARGEAGSLRRIMQAMERAEPPPGKTDEHERVVEALRATERDWRRVSRGLSGFGGPIDTFNRALSAAYKRSRGFEEDQQALGVGCLGNAKTRLDAGDYRRAAARVCRDAARRLRRVPSGAVTPTVRVGRGAARGLASIEAPDGFARLHRRTADALGDAFGRLPRLARERDADAAVEKFELAVLRAGVGFVRLGLDRCAAL